MRLPLKIDKAPAKYNTILVVITKSNLIIITIKKIEMKK